MLLGFIKSKKEKVQEDYKEYLQKSINYMRKYSSRMKNDSNDRHPLSVLSDLICIQKENDLEVEIDKILKRYAWKIPNRYGTSMLTEDVINTENEYLENELKIIILEFYELYKDFNIPEDMLTYDCGSWFYYWLIQQPNVINSEP